MPRIYGYNTANFLGPAQVKEHRLDRESQEELTREQIRSQEEIAKKQRIFDAINTAVSVGSFGLNAAQFAGLGNAAKLAKSAQALEAAGLGLEGARLGFDMSQTGVDQELEEQETARRIYETLNNREQGGMFNFGGVDNPQIESLRRSSLERMGAPAPIPEPMPQVMGDDSVVHPPTSNAGPLNYYEVPLTQEGRSRFSEVYNDLITNGVNPRDATALARDIMAEQEGLVPQDEMTRRGTTRAVRQRVGAPITGGQVPLDALGNLQEGDPGYELFQGYLQQNKGPGFKDILNILGRNTLGKFLTPNSSAQVPSSAYSYDNRKQQAQLTLEELIELLQGYGIEVQR